MRVIGGEFRSRLLKSVPGKDTRPTPDRLRETLFDILAPRIQAMSEEGSVTFADLFAGTGAVGIEALSRGAEKAIFVESNRTAAGTIRENLRSLGLEKRAELHQGRVRSIEADIVFVDPPYDDQHAYESVMNTLAAMTPRRVPKLVIVQHDRRLTLGEQYGSLRQTRRVKQGDNCLSFFEAVTIKEAEAESNPTSGGPTKDTGA